MGGLSLVSIYFFVAWVFFILLINIQPLTKKRTRSKTILLLSGYFLGLELIGRMIHASPFIPYQAGSYFMLIIFSYGILAGGIKSSIQVGKIILLLCIPGFYMIPYANYFIYFLNSFSGILSLGLAAIYFGNQRYSLQDLKDFIKVTVLPIIVIVVYISVKTPSYEDIDFTLGANFDTSGGFGSNQVSTILGAGLCLLLLAYLRKDQIFYSMKFISVVLIAAFLFRGLLTFSRGGIIGGILSVLFAYFYLSSKNASKFVINVFRIILVSLSLIFLFFLSDRLTGGLLSERYQGDTKATLSGRKEKNLAVLTTNRSYLAEIEWNIFTQNVFFGVGPGRGYEEREKSFGSSIASHTEITRLLAEQGLPGLAIGFIFLFYPLLRIKNATSSMETYYLIAFFFLAVFTSMHAGMRTMVTPLFWGLACAKYHMPKPVNKAFNTRNEYKHYSYNSATQKLT